MGFVHAAFERAQGNFPELAHLIRGKLQPCLNVKRIARADHVRPLQSDGTSPAMTSSRTKRKVINQKLSHSVQAAEGRSSQPMPAMEGRPLAPKSTPACELSRQSFPGVQLHRQGNTALHNRVKSVRRFPVRLNGGKRYSRSRRPAPGRPGCGARQQPSPFHRRQGAAPLRGWASPRTKPASCSYMFGMGRGSSGIKDCSP